eukprot:NODE_2155_length_1265_cov_58.955185_g2049_i0.p1 GENE.NODE_2155_length_1265_cov_58.955185_g2049_i0~~NODE_2155_length_1265_cov_58.955185_g2049_i0.p1  ORF type:complete len:417 (-),score=123.83 NODE_2155_length_1265_cov_58.955185_g2049_i0:15-1232(-)
MSDDLLGQMGLKVDTSVEMGQCLVATREFPMGADIFCELPFATFVSDRNEVPPDAAAQQLLTALEGIAAHFQVTPYVLLPLITFAQCNSELLEAITAAFNVPEVDESTPSWQHLRLACTAAAELPSLQAHTPQACFMFLRLLRDNAFVVYPTPYPAMGLFKLAARLNHSCNPNLFFLVHHSTLVLRCLRPLHPNDVLTISYLPDTDLWKPCSTRRATLELRKGFKCVCARCRGADVVRTMKCPGCRMDAAEPQQDDTWHCAECSRTYPSTALPLQAERLMEQCIEACFVDHTTTADPLATLKHCHATLGAKHWLATTLVYLLLVRYVEDNSTLPTPVAMDLACKLADWFHAVLPGASPTAVMLHFASSLLMGYDSDSEFHKTQADRYLQMARPVLRVRSLDPNTE